MDFFPDGWRILIKPATLVPFDRIVAVVAFEAGRGSQVDVVAITAAGVFMVDTGHSITAVWM